MSALNNNIHSNELKDRIVSVLKEWVLQGDLELDVVVTLAKKPFEGRYVTTLAFLAAKAMRVSPTQIAQTLAMVLNDSTHLQGMHAEAVEGFVNIEVALPLRIQSFENFLNETQNPTSIDVELEELMILTDPPYWLYRALFLYKRLEKETVFVLSLEDFSKVLETQAFGGVKQFLEYQEPLERLQHWLSTLVVRENLSHWTPEQLGALKKVAEWLIRSLSH